MTLASGVYKVSGFTLVSLNFTIETMYICYVVRSSLALLVMELWGFPSFLVSAVALVS